MNKRTYFTPEAHDPDVLKIAELVFLDADKNYQKKHFKKKNLPTVGTVASRIERIITSKMAGSIRLDANTINALKDVSRSIKKKDMSFDELITFLIHYYQSREEEHIMVRREIIV